METHPPRGAAFCPFAQRHHDRLGEGVVSRHGVVYVVIKGRFAMTLMETSEAGFSLMDPFQSLGRHPSLLFS